MNDSNQPPERDASISGPDDASRDAAVTVPTTPPAVEARLDAELPAAAGSRGGSAPPPPAEADDEPVEEKELGGRMTFLEHLEELRKRILYSVISILITFVAGWTFREEIYRFLSAPIKTVVDRLVVITPTEPFTIYLKVSFVAAIFLAAPVILAQVWMFIAPGLYRREKKFAFPFLFSSTILFLLGGAFAYYVVLPPALNFLLKEFGREFQPMITAMEFFDFALLIIVGMGAIFQLPVLVAFLSIFGLVTPGFLWRNFRYAFLLITIIAALVSPTTDPFNLFLWSGPMVVLYTVSIGISWIFKRRRDTENRGRE
jgi:sec-independent protein translocase protein TatC